MGSMGIPGKGKYTTFGDAMGSRSGGISWGPPWLTKLLSISRFNHYFLSSGGRGCTSRLSNTPRLIISSLVSSFSFWPKH